MQYKLKETSSSAEVTHSLQVQQQLGKPQNGNRMDDALSRNIWWNATESGFTVFSVSVEDFSRSISDDARRTSQRSLGLKQMEYTLYYFHGSL